MSSPKIKPPLFSVFSQSIRHVWQDKTMAAPYIGLFLLYFIVDSWIKVPQWDPMALKLDTLKFQSILWSADLFCKSIVTLGFLNMITKPKIQISFATRFPLIILVAGGLASLLIATFLGLASQPSESNLRFLLIFGFLFSIPAGILIEFLPSIILHRTGGLVRIAKSSFLFLKTNFFRSILALFFGISLLFLGSVIGGGLTHSIPLIGGALSAVLQGFLYTIVNGYYCLFYIHSQDE